MPEDLQPLVDELKATVAILQAKITDLQARTTLTDQQVIDVRAAVDALSALGKS